MTDSEKKYYYSTTRGGKGKPCSRRSTWDKNNTLPKKYAHAGRGGRSLGMQMQMQCKARRAAGRSRRWWCIRGPSQLSDKESWEPKGKGKIRRPTVMINIIISSLPLGAGPCCCCRRCARCSSSAAAVLHAIAIAMPNCQCHHQQEGKERAPRPHAACPRPWPWPCSFLILPS
jgi:hypothetical protein